MGTPAEQQGKPSLVERLREKREAHRERSRIIRALYVAIGITVLLCGLAMLVTPGPAFVIIPIGLAILSLEFTWAENLLEKAIEQGEKAKQKAAETTTTQRVLTGIATALAIAAFAVWWLWGDVPVIPGPPGWLDPN